MSLWRLLVRGLGEIFITVGLLVLLFVGWQLFWTDVTAGRAQASITGDLQRRWAGGAPVAPASPSPSVPASQAPVVPDVPDVPDVPLGDAFAIVRIPRFSPDYARPVLEGTSLKILQRGVGHYDGTAGPGEVGNFAVAAHRTTYGRPFNLIARLRPGDPIVVETASEWYVYRVRSQVIVSPRDVAVIEPVPGRRGARPTERLMTLTTCHPMFSARQRFVVHAVLDTQQPRAAGPPVALTSAPGG